MKSRTVHGSVPVASIRPRVNQWATSPTKSAAQATAMVMIMGA